MDATASIPRQRAELLALAKKSGDMVLEVFDEAMSAHETGRPAFERMMARLHEVQAVYVVAYDRLTRIPDPTEQEKIRKAFVAARVDIITPGMALRYSDPTFDSPETRLHQRALGMFGSFEWDSIVRRLRKGKLAKAKAGVYFGHPVPYGYAMSYDQHSGAKLFAPDEAQAAVVRMIFTLYLEGHGAPAIVRELNHLGVPSPTGRKWNTGTVRKMLAQDLYVGRSNFGGKGSWRKAGQEALTETPIIVESQAFPPLLDVATWDAVQAQRPARSRRRQGVESVYPLTGILRCPGCDAPMRSHNTWAKRIGPTYYACRQVESEYKLGLSGAAQTCGMRTYYNMDTAHEALFTWLVVHLPRYALGKHRKKKAERPRGTEMMDAARRRVADLERQWVAAANLAEMGVYKPDEAAARFDALRAEIAQAKSHLDGLTRTQQAPSAGPMAVSGVLEKLKLMDADAPELKGMYAALLAEIHLEKLPKNGRLIPLAVVRVRFVNGDWYPGPPPG